ncbi:MAG: gliding motility-associated C-terminal domain-containing protein, partial [Bacteroidales bacterium]|nr:gliding motility-associated C-terminal domain-containing protein [Bacteroidales bacterium]
TISDNNILSAEQTVCWFDQPGVLQGSDPGGGYLGLYAYTWESRTLATGWTGADDTNGNDQKSYTPPVMTGDTTWFRRVVGSGGVARNVCTDVSDSVAIHVLPSITNNKVRTDVDVNCQDDLLADLIQDDTEGSTPGGGATQGGTDITRKYKWEQATGMGAPGANWTEVSYGPVEIDYTGHPELTEADDYWYHRIVFSGPGLGGQDQVCSDTSDLIHITIHTAIADNTIDPADSACFNSTKVVHGAVPSGEPDLNPTYSWLDMVAGTELPGSDGQDYTHIFVSHDPHQFRRTTRIGECEDTSDVMVITIMELPGGVISGDLPRACEQDVLLDIDLHKESLTNFIIPWEVYLDDGVNTGLVGPYFMDEDGPVEVTLDTPADSTQFDYTIGEIIYRSATGRYECAAPLGNMTGNVPIKVFRTPIPVIWESGEARDSFKVCGNEVTLEVDPDRGVGNWTSNYPEYLGFLPNPSAVNVRANIDPNDSIAFEIQKYTLTFASWAGVCAGKDSIEVHYFEQPEKANPGGDTMIFLKNSLYLNADPPTAGIGTWTVISGNGIFEDEHAHNTFVYDLAKGENNEFRWTIVNGEDEGTCIETDSILIVTQNEVRRYDGFSPNGDNINDYFIIQGLANADEFSISFFNALGKTVRTLTQETIGELDYDPAMISGGLKKDELVIWDGNASNGTEVPPGTYYYVVSMMINQLDHAGNITSTDRYEYKDYVIVRD